MTRNSLTPVCVWRVSPSLVTQLQERFGDPLDTYVNGSQVWLREDGPNEVTLEWRLHPVAGYQRPSGVETIDVFTVTAMAISNGDPPPAPLDQLWDGLEAFPAYDDETEPALLRTSCVQSLGLDPDASGLVDHKTVGDSWERSQGAISIVDRLLAQLTSSGP